MIESLSGFGSLRTRPSLLQMLERKAQAFPRLWWVSRTLETFSRDSRCFSRRWAASPRWPHRVRFHWAWRSMFHKACIVPIIRFTRKCREHTMMYDNAICWCYVLMTRTINRKERSRGLILGSKLCNSVPLWGKNNSFIVLIIFFPTEKRNNGSQDWSPSVLLLKMIKLTAHTHRKKKKANWYRDIWSCIIPAYWKVGSSVLMRIFSVVFILGTKQILSKINTQSSVCSEYKPVITHFDFKCSTSGRGSTVALRVSQCA